MINHIGYPHLCKPPYGKTIVYAYVLLFHEPLQVDPSSRTLIYAALMPLNSLWINEAFAGPSGGDVQLEGEEPSFGDDLRKNKP